MRSWLTIPLAMASPRVVVSRTFSKAFGLAGLRIGYAVGNAALGTMEEMQQAVSVFREILKA